MFVKNSFLVKESFLRYFSSSSSSSSNVFKIGDVLRQRRTFSNEDVSEYSKVSHDVNPLHFDSESARAAGFEDRLVHGLLVASLFPRIISAHFVYTSMLEPAEVHSTSTTCSCYSQSPIYIGDETVGEVEAISIKQSKRRYIAKLSTKCFKNGGLLVIDGEAMAILPTLTMEQANTHAGTEPH